MLRWVTPLLQAQVVRFGLVGFINTAVDVLLFLSLRHLGFNVIAANIISTSSALGCSFVLNRKFAFSSNISAKRSGPVFVAVTLIGLWILQPLVILLVIYVLRSSVLAHVITHVVVLTARQQELVAKLAATPVTLAWNYVLYKRLVFRNSPDTRPSETGETLQSHY